MSQSVVPIAPVESTGRELPAGRVGQILEWFKSVQALAEGAAKGVIILAMLVSMVWFGWIADPSRENPAVAFADRILSWSFVVFSVGLAELFVLLVVLTVLGKVDLPSTFFDKEPDPAKTSALSSRLAAPAISLSRLQAFMWTLVVMTAYFHRVVKDGSGSLPAIPPELLMVMGISGATYLISKNIDSASTEKKAALKGKVKSQDGESAQRGESNEPTPTREG